MVADDLTKKGARVSAAMVLAESSWDILMSALKGVILDMFVIWYRRSLDTQGIHTPQTQMYTIPITKEVLWGKHQNHSGPTLPSTWAHCHCHAHSLRAAARCQVYVPTSGIIKLKIHTQGLHTPPPQTYTIPIMREVLSGKHQSQSTPPSTPTLSST